MTIELAIRRLECEWSHAPEARPICYFRRERAVFGCAPARLNWPVSRGAPGKWSSPRRGALRKSSIIEPLDRWRGFSQDCFKPLGRTNGPLRRSPRRRRRLRKGVSCRKWNLRAQWSSTFRCRQESPQEWIDFRACCARRGRAASRSTAGRRRRRHAAPHCNVRDSLPLCPARRGLFRGRRGWRPVLRLISFPACEQHGIITCDRTVRHAGVLWFSWTFFFCIEGMRAHDGASTRPFLARVFPLSTSRSCRLTPTFCARTSGRGQFCRWSRMSAPRSAGVRMRMFFLPRMSAYDDIVSKVSDRRHPGMSANGDMQVTADCGPG